MPSKIKRFKCPYCEKRYEREDLVRHIEKKHIDDLPEGFSPLRMVFHVANKRDISYRRPCRVCGKPTPWDENKGRYDQLCGSKSCHDKYVELMHKNMHYRVGVNRPTASPEGLEKMLANRRISGRYKFQDGTEKVYTGSYEKKALEFMDKVMNCKSEDIQCPGPVFQYELDGQYHTYISDLYYEPYHLIIEVKDGGDHPNQNKSYAETRRKQMAKEEYIIKKTDYNYLRLTDNDFSQLLAIFADLKMNLMENNLEERVIHVNENMPAMGTAPMVGMNDVVIVNYMQNNVFSGGEEEYAIADNPKFDSVFARNGEGYLKKTDKKVFENTQYTPYIVRDVKDKIMPILQERENTYVPREFIYEVLFGHELRSPYQLQFENNVEPYPDFYTTYMESSHKGE